VNELKDLSGKRVFEPGSVAVALNFKAPCGDLLLRRLWPVEHGDHHRERKMRPAPRGLKFGEQVNWRSRKGWGARAQSMIHGRGAGALYRVIELLAPAGALPCATESTSLTSFSGGVQELTRTQPELSPPTISSDWWRCGIST
jgi:hypothetical protein